MSSAVQIRELEVQEETKDMGAGPNHREKEALEPREEAVFPTHTTRFWILVGPPQGTGAEPGSIRSMQKASQRHLPRTEQLGRFGAVGPYDRLARAKMRACPKPAGSQKQFSFHFLNK